MEAIVEKLRSQCLDFDDQFEIANVQDNSADFEPAPFNRKACQLALAGQQVPTSLQHPLHRLCTIHGMRNHDGFGVELLGLDKVYTRSVYARNIMSGTIPTFQVADDIPYCIWYPQTASEATYRLLYERYGTAFPQISYLVGRACAVAGYTALYAELNILPDTHIAEEARESGYMDIYNIIMAQTRRYDIMNDYERTINLDNSALPSYLNGDTCPLWMLQLERLADDAGDGFVSKSTGEFVPTAHRGYTIKPVFDLTEDMGVAKLPRSHDEDDPYEEAMTVTVASADIELLHQPLPVDLPTVRKDILITMAAYTGNIDRYVRLRRPRPVQHELHCCEHGIYHDAMFALWWSKQPNVVKPLRQAINARMIVMNILSGAPYPRDETPYTIWSPVAAAPRTYEALAKLQPDMIPQIIHACIAADYQELFISLLPSITPDASHTSAARRAGRPFYVAALGERLAALDLAQPLPLPRDASVAWKPSGAYSVQILARLNTRCIDTSDAWPDVPGRWCDATSIEFNAALPPAYRTGPEGEDGNRSDLDYERWPPQCLPLRQHDADLAP